MALTLSPHRLQKARSMYNLFNALNTVSWTFLAGNIITLFAMRLDASSTLVGALTAINYGAFFFLFFGRYFAKKIPIVHIYAVTWTLRSLAMIPLLFAPHLSTSGHNKTAISLLLIGVTLFHITRGIGMVGNNPLLSFVAQGPDRSSYMTLIQVINNGVGMLSTFGLALFLGSQSPLFLYSIIMGAGIVIGIASAVVISKVPEPDSQEKAIDSDFFKVVRGPLSEPPLRFFILIMFLVCMISGIVRTFVLVYSREVFAQGDGLVTLYSVFGSLGSLVVGLIIKFLIDRVGAKPIYVLCNIAGVVSLLPAIFFPNLAGAGSEAQVSVILYLSALFFIVNFAFLGAEGVGQTYFLGLVPRKYMLDMSIVYFFVYALAGAGGTFFAGIFLDVLNALGLSHFAAFRVLHILMAALLLVVLVLQRKLTSLGAIPLSEAINLLFSPRDLKAIALMEKLRQADGAEQEEVVLEELSENASPFAIGAILEKLRSPRFAVRLEALNALYSLPRIDEDAKRVLLDNLTRNTHTTAYYSARILGKHRVQDALPVLREALLSTDLMLKGEAMIALARLKDGESFTKVEDIIRETDNPRLKIMGFEALSSWGDSEAIPLLIDSLSTDADGAHIRDEAALTLASLLGVGALYYKLLVRYAEEPENFRTFAKDEVESACDYFRQMRGGAKKASSKNGCGTENYCLKKAVASFLDNGDGRALSDWIRGIPVLDKKIQAVLAEAALDKRLYEIDIFKLLLVQWVARRLRLSARK